MTASARPLASDVPPPLEGPARSPTHLVVRNASAALGGQVALKVLGVLFSVFVARRLGDADLGRYAAAVAYVGMFAVLTDLGTSALFLRTLARQRSEATWAVPTVASLRAALSLAMLVVIPLSAWLLGKSIDMVVAIVVATCGLLLYAWLGPLSTLLMAAERFDYNTLVTVLNQAVFLLVGTTVLLLGGRVVALLGAALVGTLAAAVVASVVTRRVLGIRFGRPDPSRWGTVLRAAAPFAAKMVTLEAATRFDTVFLSFKMPAAVVGWYAVPGTLIATTLFVAQSIASSVHPSLVREYALQPEALRVTLPRLVRYFMLLAVPAMIGGIVVADALILVLYGTQFAPSIPLLRAMVCGLPALFLAELLGRAANAMHLERAAARVSLVSATVCIALVGTLVPACGALGAALAMVTMRLIEVGLLCRLMGTAYVFERGTGWWLRTIGAALIMGASVWLVQQMGRGAGLDPRLVLPLAIAAGVVTYGAAVVALGAVTRAEVRALRAGVVALAPSGWRRR